MNCRRSPIEVLRHGGYIRMKEQIGATAGAIWDILNDVDQMAISKLPKAVKEKEALTYQALGWLAREDKVAFVSRGKTTYVQLNNR